MIAHTCACGVARDLAAWERLPLVGTQPDEPHALELRNCTCGSTIALARPVPAAVQHAADAALARGLSVAGRRRGRHLAWLEVRSRGPLPDGLHRPLVEAGFVLRRGRDAAPVVWRWTPPQKRNVGVGQSADRRTGT